MKSDVLCVLILEYSLPVTEVLYYHVWGWVCRPSIMTPWVIPLTTYYLLRSTIIVRRRLLGIHTWGLAQPSCCLTFAACRETQDTHARYTPAFARESEFKG